LTLNAVVVQIEGASYRLRRHAELVPDHIRAKALIDPASALAIPPQKRSGQRTSLQAPSLLGH
jgi:hypothetical protein